LPTGLSRFITPSPFLRFFCFQCWLTALVTLASQVRSLVSSRISVVAKYLTLLGCGLPSGFSSRATTSTGTSCGWQFNTHAVCSTVNRAGSCPSRFKKRCWSSFISVGYFWSRFVGSTIPSPCRNCGSAPTVKGVGENAPPSFIGGPQLRSVGLVFRCTCASGVVIDAIP